MCNELFQLEKRGNVNMAEPILTSFEADRKTNKMKKKHNNKYQKPGNS